MDIDFHYYATYVAARFAGYPKEDALTIATSAQMIDENSRHVLVGKTSQYTTGLMGFPDDFQLRHHANGPAIHTYRVQMTFQGLGDIGTSSTDTLSSIWPVYHFLPGNFSNPGNSKNRWNQRTLKSSYASDKTVSQHFEWLCRPHSAMAIRLVNNCRELIHDTHSVINKHQLANYLVGVTMHVFADTWAHQDFVGFGVRQINSRGEIEEKKEWFGSSLKDRRWDLSYSYVKPVSVFDLPSITGHTEKVYSQQTTWKNCDWKDCAPKQMALMSSNAAIGHGIVGHLPDHSSVIWKYKPAWSDQERIRNNPVEYFDAFVHLVWAMRCIRLNKEYSPFDVTPETISAKIDVSKGHLLAIYKMIALERHPWSKGANEVKVLENSDDLDTWDGMIFLHGFQWQDLIENVLGFEHLDSWVPGQSPWMLDAYETLQSNQEQKKGNWYTVQQFKTLDFFKFNMAAKFHYRFVKQQLLTFNKLLLGNWADGAAYADDLERIDDNESSHQIWLQDIVTKLSDLQRKEKIREVNEGMTILIRDIESSGSLADVYMILKTLVDNVNTRAPWTYGLLNDKGQKQGSAAFETIKDIIKTYKEAAGTTSTITELVQQALDDYESHKKKLFTSQSNESLKAARKLASMLESHSSNTTIRSYLIFLLGLKTSNQFLDVPLKKGSKLYTLLYKAYIKAPPVR